MTVWAFVSNVDKQGAFAPARAQDGLQQVWSPPGEGSPSGSGVENVVFGCLRVCIRSDWVLRPFVLRPQQERITGTNTGISTPRRY